MARKRARRRAAGTMLSQDSIARGINANMNGRNGPSSAVNDSGVMVNMRQISTGDEGVLYTHRIVERAAPQRKSRLYQLAHLTHRRKHDNENNSVESARSTGSLTPRRTLSNNGTGTASSNRRSKSPTARPSPPQSDTLRGFRGFFGKDQKQYTIASKKKYRSKVLNWIDKRHMNFVGYFCHSQEIDSHEVDNDVYRPFTSLYHYIDWTFGASFTSVFMTFLIIYLVLCLVFGGFLFVAGEAEPNCIVATGESFGANPHTKFSDAFALSWTTFTTVGYGMTYTSTGADFGDTEPHECSWVVLLCTIEAFMGLLFAGMGAAILFGKVNRVQSHANIIFCNAVCLQYEEVEEDLVDDNESVSSQPPTPVPESEDEENPSVRSQRPTPVPEFEVPEFEDEENPVEVEIAPQSQPPTPVPEFEDEENPAAVEIAPQSQEESKFVEQFNGCPILKFQVANELCNREGGELVDCIMKVVGIKFKGPEGRITHSQYVRVNLVDNEHPFLSRVWHGVHVLDSTSPLLTDRARQRIRENNGSWPSNWFDPDIIRSKLEFHDLIVTLAGVSNVSAVTVHAYKRYKIGDVLIGYNFAPMVFRDVETGALEVDLSMCNDVREQCGIRGEDLSIRQTGNSEETTVGLTNSTIRIKRSKSRVGSVTSQQSVGSKGIAASVLTDPVG